MGSRLGRARRKNLDHDRTTPGSALRSRADERQWRKLDFAITVGNLRKDVIEVAWDERQCNDLLTVLGRAMLRLTATDLHNSPRTP
jgi:hypothetical protein